MLNNDYVKIGSWKIRLIDNAKDLYLRLWSNRLMLVAALFSGAEAGYSYYVGREVWPALIAFCLSFGATIARMIPQPKTIEKVNGNT